MDRAHGSGSPARAIAYLRPPVQDGAVRVPWTREHARQDRAVRSWAAEQGAEIVATVVDEKGRDEHRIGARAGLLEAITRVHDGDGDLVCFASLADLDADLVVQEFLLEHARTRNVAMASADADDQAALADPPADPHRGLIRRIMREIPALEGELRSTRARMHRGDLSDLAPALSELEAMQEHGDPGFAARGAERARVHRIADWLRTRRQLVGARRNPEGPAGT